MEHVVFICLVSILALVAASLLGLATCRRHGMYRAVVLVISFAVALSLLTQAWVEFDFRQLVDLMALVIGSGLMLYCHQTLETKWKRSRAKKAWFDVGPLRG